MRDTKFEFLIKELEGTLMRSLDQNTGSVGADCMALLPQVTMMLNTHRSAGSAGPKKCHGSFVPFGPNHPFVKVQQIS